MDRRDTGMRADRFGWEPGVELNYYDASGKKISKEAWRENMKKKAEKKAANKPPE